MIAEILNTVTSFSVDGPLVNVFKLLEPLAKVAGALKSLIGLAPIK